MSGAMENRAAVFTNQPQDVEVYQDEVWWPGSLLGWRHDTHGSCQVWVRIDIGGSETTTWTELEALRLPSLAPQPGGDTRVTAVVAHPWAESANTGALVADPAATREMQRVGDAIPPARRSPRVAEAAAATLEPPVLESVPSSRLAAARAEQAPAPGRHRAPAPAAAGGRHRAADTETCAAVTETDSTVRQRLPWPMAVESGWPVAVEDPRPASGGAPWAPQTEPDLERFTRPLRLNSAASASASQRRGTDWDARLRGA